MCQIWQPMANLWAILLIRMCSAISMQQVKQAPHPLASFIQINIINYHINNSKLTINNYSSSSSNNNTTNRTYHKQCPIITTIIKQRQVWWQITETRYFGRRLSRRKIGSQAFLKTHHHSLQHPLHHHHHRRRPLLHRLRLRHHHRHQTMTHKTIITTKTC